MKSGLNPGRARGDGIRKISGVSLPWCNEGLSEEPGIEVAATAALIQRVHTKPPPFVFDKPLLARHAEKHEVRDHF
jgi:hypothetical protein